MNRVGPLALISVCTLALACDKQPDGPATVSPDDTPAEAGRQDPSHTHATLGSGAATEVHAGMAPNTSGILRSTHTGTSSYDRNAPATVLITTRWGHGSGVIIDPSGLVLTNYHVVESGEQEDFRIEVGVTTAKINADGSADPDQELRAVAVKVDPKRDLALLQILDAPKGLVAAPLADVDRPAPGRKVSAIGNAGVGFGWAVKHCSINGIGTMENAVETLFVGRTEAVPKDQRDAVLEAMREAAREAGLQIQTDCTVLPGDSGGPLIDEETHEVIGLNVATRTSVKGERSLGSVSFHIHVKELRHFVGPATQLSTDPLYAVPDPWAIAGLHGELDDTDRDGEVDTLMIGGTCGSEHMLCHAVFVDMDQDSFDGAKSLPDIQEVFEGRKLDSEWVMFTRPRYPRGGTVGDHLAPVSDSMFYFDGDNDGAFDGVIVADGETGQTRGYRIAAGKVTRDASLDELMDGPVDLFESQADKRRMARFQSAIVDGTHASAIETTAAVDVQLVDLDADGRQDTALVDTRVDTRLMVDVDQDALPDSDADSVTMTLATGTVDAEFIAVASAPYRVYYDTDNDGRFDLMLEGSTPQEGFAIDAAVLGADGKRTPAPEHVGRRLLRPDLVDSSLAVPAEKMLDAAFPNQHSTVGDPRSTFPSLAVGWMFEVRPYAESSNTIIVAEPGREMLMADLDGDSSKRKANKGKSLEEMVANESFDAEFVFIYDGALAWGYYDTDNDGSFDLIWVASGDDPGHPRHAFTIDGATVTHADPAPGVTMFEASNYASKKLRKKFQGMRDMVVEM